VAFALRLRRSGVSVGLTNVEVYTRALAACPPRSLSELYWVARISLVRRRDDLEVFDQVFSAVFDGAGLPLDPHARRRPRASDSGDEAFSALPGTRGDDEDGKGLPWVTLPKVISTAAGSDSALAVPERAPSPLDGLADTPFDELDPSELAQVGAWLRSALERWPARRSRRMDRHPAGRRIALRATLALARRTGWEPIDLVFNRQVTKPRRVVMLCDVSQSMQAYTAAYFHLMRAVTVGTDAEVFAFATSLTRLTPILGRKSVSGAIEGATAKVADRFGGTRIASNVRALLASHHGGTTWGAVVIIASDGWDSDLPADLALAMARLRRRAYRVIWLNPRAAAPGFAPLVGAMAAALPYCDELFPADNLRSLEEVIASISRSGCLRRRQ